MRYFSMFSGIGGFDLALTRSGHECIGYSEIDKWAIRNYRRNFGTGVKNHGDATKINPVDDLGDFELLCGGFPCQSFSIAGKRRGFKDTRGTLFFEIARIAQAKKPRYLFLENVKGLLNHDKGRTFATIISTLWELGYDVEWGVCNSRYFGVPQNRERVFIIGRLRGEPGSKVFPLRREGTSFDGKNQSTALDRNYWKGIDNHGARTGIITDYGHLEKSPQMSDISPTLKAQSHGHEPMVCAFLTPDRLEKRQNGRRFKEVGEPMFTLNAQDQHGILQLNNPIHSNDRVYSEEGLSPTLNTMQGGLRQPFVMVGYSRSAEGGISHHLKDVAGTIKGGASGKTSNQSEYVLVPEATKQGYAVAMEGDSINLSQPNSNTRRGRVGKGCANTLDTAMSQYTICDRSIRRLTPLECERLQGFPDGWTSEGLTISGKRIPISDSQRYKLCGNAVTVSVVEAIASAWRFA